MPKMSYFTFVSIDYCSLLLYLILIPCSVLKYKKKLYNYWRPAIVLLVLARSVISTSTADTLWRPQQQCKADRWLAAVSSKVMPSGPSSVSQLFQQSLVSLPIKHELNSSIYGINIRDDINHYKLYFKRNSGVPISLTITRCREICYQ